LVPNREHVPSLAAELGLDFEELEEQATDQRWRRRAR